MKLKTMGLTNFRGFERLDIDFDEKMTVIAGVNGVGKSSILDAIAIAYSHALPEFTASREKPLFIVNSDIQQGKSSCSIELESTDLLSASLITRLLKESLDKNERLVIEDKLPSMKEQLSEMRKGTPVYKNLRNEIIWAEKRLQGTFEKIQNWLFTDVYETETRLKRHLKSSPNQPLVVHYSTKRFLSRLPPKLSSAPPFKQAAAYAKSLKQVEVSLSDFAKWHRALFSNRVIRKDSQHGATILKCLDEAVTELLPDIKGFYLQESNPPHYEVMKNATLEEQVRGGKSGVRLSLEQLSDGERGLIALIFDLVRRLSIANPDSDNPIAEGVALVLIDEIELHLHPRWQRDAIKRLPKIFENCQFVITTHSPQVIGEVQAQCVRLLSMKDFRVICETPGMAYGTDSNWILSVLMGADEMSETVENDLATIASFISDRKLKEAREKIGEVRAVVGNTEAIQKMASAIERIERLGK